MEKLQRFFRRAGVEEVGGVLDGFEGRDGPLGRGGEEEEEEEEEVELHQNKN